MKPATIVVHFAEIDGFKTNNGDIFEIYQKHGNDKQLYVCKKSAETIANNNKESFTLEDFLLRGIYNYDKVEATLKSSVFDQKSVTILFEEGIISRFYWEIFKFISFDFYSALFSNFKYVANGG